MRRATGAWLAIALISSAAGAGGPPSCTRALLARLERGGRAETRVTVTIREGDLGAQSRRGVVMLELPDRMRLEYPGSGERLTARGDGGEWLQPAARQMLVMSADQAARAAGMWRALRGAGGAGFEERRLGARSFELVSDGKKVAEAETVRVVLGGDGLPATLETRLGDMVWTVRFGGWRFSPSRGRSAFVLHAPAGYEVMPMP